MVLTRSTHTEIGLSNGTIGIFKELVYIEENDVEEFENLKKNVIDTTIFPPDTIYIRNPLYILVELIEDKPLPTLQHLPPKIVPISFEIQSFKMDLSKLLILSKFKKGPSITVSRRQLPINPGYSFSTYKSQGLTLPEVILDLVAPPPPNVNELALTYVPITRVKNLKDLVFFRDFPLSAIQIQPSLDQKKELARLENLNEKTKRKYNEQYSL